MQNTVETILLNHQQTSYGTLVNPLNWDWMIPAGSVIPFAGINRPVGWLLADGSAVSRTTYAHLFEVLGTTYGSGDGSTTFNLPNLKGSVIVGYDGSQTEFNTLNKKGGEKTHTLTIDEIPSHGHTGTIGSTGIHDHSGTIGINGSHNHTGTTDSDGSHTHTQTTINDDFNNSGGNYGGNYSYPSYPPSDSAGSITWTNTINSAGAHTHTFSTSTNGSHSHSLTIDQNGNHSHPITIDNNGGGNAHNNLQPYTTLFYIIKY